MTLVCITNDILDLRPCVVKGRHDQFCQGVQRRFNHIEGRVEVALTPDKKTIPCTGCLPRKAEHGLLCWSCWEKVKDALDTAIDMITHLRSVERAQQVDNAGIRSKQNWVIPVPASWRTADELIMLAGHPSPGFPSDANVWEVEAITERYIDPIDPAMWVASEAGAEAAVRFFITMQHAMAQHPMKEYEHRVRNVRCYKCRQRTLLWKPPLEFEDAVHVVCTNPKCGAEIDQTMYERLTVLEKDARKTKREAEQAAANPTPEEGAQAS